MSFALLTYILLRRQFPNQIIVLFDYDPKSAKSINDVKSNLFQAIQDRTTQEQRRVLP